MSFGIHPADVEPRPAWAEHPRELTWIEFCALADHLDRQAEEANKKR